MSFLVSTYQEKLGCSRSESKWRVWVTLIGVTFASVVIGLAAWNFPRTSSYEKQIELPPGNYIQVDQIINGDVLVSSQQFGVLSEGQQIFVSVKAANRDTLVSRYVKVGGVGYRFNQDYGHKFPYSVSNGKMAGNTLTFELSRDWTEITVALIILPALCLTLASIVVYLATVKATSNGRFQTTRTLW